MDEEVKKDKEKEEFEREKEERERRDEEKTRKNREKREKMKARKSKKGKGGNGNGNAKEGGAEGKDKGIKPNASAPKRSIDEDGDDDKKASTGEAKEANGTDKAASSAEPVGIVIHDDD